MDREIATVETLDDSHDFGPLTRRQAENIANFTIRHYESQQYEKLGRAVAKKVLYLVGAAGGSLWLLMSGKAGHLIEVLLK